MKILVVDDQILFREGLVALLNNDPHFQVIAEASSGYEAICKVREHKPDLVLMDFNLPDICGPEATRMILAENPGTIVVFLTVHEDSNRLFEAIRSGARGYLLKNLPVSKVIASLRGLEKNEAPISRVMMKPILEEFARFKFPGEPDTSPMAALTPREVEILRELASYASNQEIAARLYLSETTVKNHIHKILTKLNLKNRYELARFASQQGLLNPPERPVVFHNL